MYTNVTQSFIDAITSTYQKRKFKAEITYKNSSGATVTETFTQDAFVAGTFSLEMSCMPSSSFDVGGTVAQDLTISLYNQDRQYNGCKFQNGVIKPYFGILDSSGVTQWCPLGVFIIDNAGKSYDRTIQLKAVDQILKFEKSMDGFEFSGSTLAALLQKMCSDLGISCNTNFLNSTYTFQPFDTTDLTYRDVLGYIAAAAGGFARMGKDNVLEIVSFEINKGAALEIAPEKTRIECDIDEPVVIDSIAYYVAEGANKLIGDGLYSLSIENNVLFDNLDDLDGLLNSLYTKYNNFTYYPFNASYMGDPRLEPGDTVFLKRTVEGDIYTFVNKQKLSLSGFSSIETPVCDELDKNFMDSYKVKQAETPSSGGGGGGGITKTVNPNLLLRSLFIKPFLPISACNSTTQTVNLEAFDTYLFAELDTSNQSVNRVWLPYQGDIEPGATYTFSCYIRKRNTTAAVKTNYHLLLVPNYTVVESDQTLLNSMARAYRVGVSGTYDLGVITTGDVWEWLSLTFTVPEVLERGVDEYMLMLLADQGYMYTDSYTSKYAACIQKAKLEKGSVMTDWCLGEGESISGDFKLDEQGRIMSTKTAVVNSNIGVYDYKRCLYGPCTRLYNGTDGYIEVLGKTGDKEGAQQHQINICHTNTGKGTAARIVKLATRSDTGALEITAPGGLYINGTLQG